MKYIVNTLWVAWALMCGAANAQVPTGQYCPVAADFTLRLDSLIPSGYFNLEFNPAPPGYTGIVFPTVDEVTRVVTVRGRSYSAIFPGPSPVVQGVGPVSPGPYRMVFNYFYYDAQGSSQDCPTFEIPFVVPGGAVQQAVPTPNLGKWMMLILASLLGGIGIATQRRLRRG